MAQVVLMDKIMHYVVGIATSSGGWPMSMNAIFLPEIVVIPGKSQEIMASRISVTT